MTTQSCCAKGAKVLSVGATDGVCFWFGQRQE
jgi:hypothetical protein